jgi:hypothetical protein
MRTLGIAAAAVLSVLLSAFANHTESSESHAVM